ncbi:MAG: hypothetical protein O7B99_03150, partial [Planctomycetota bacterium]|nr:hypothetical protein [Planctomycetota bacterium]
PAFALLFALAPLFYWPLAGWRADGVWTEPAWLWPVVAAAFFGALAVEAGSKLRQKAKLRKTGNAA